MNQLIPVPMIGGVDLLRDAKRISPFALAKCQNLIPTKVGFMATRGGTDWFQNVFMSTVYLPIKFLFPPTQAFSLLVATRNAFPITDDPVATPAQNTRIHVVTDAGGSFDTSQQEFDMAAITPIRPALVAFRNQMYAFAGPAARACYTFADPATVNGIRVGAFAFNGVDNALFPYVACSYRQRMCYFNFGAGYECSGIFSNNNDPATIGNAALGTREFTFGAKDGDRIVAAVEVVQTGAAIDAMLLILKEYSAYFMTGEPNQTTDPAAISLLNDAQVMRSPVDCGCSSAETVVTTPYGVIWAGPDDVWMFTQGQQPRRIGTKIRERLKLTGPTFRYLWHAAYYDGFYRLAIASAEQAPWVNDDSKMEEQWWLDLREGPPQGAEDAKWYGPMKYKIANRTQFLPFVNSNAYWGGGTRCMTVDARPGHLNGLFGLDIAQQDRAFAFGPAVRMFAFDSGQPYDSCLDYSPGVGTFKRADVVNNEADIAVWTKEYAAISFNGEQTADDPMVEKLMLGAELAAWVSDYCRISIDLVLDGGRKVATYVKDVATKGFITSVDPLDAGPVTEEFQALALSAGSDRQQGKYYQGRLYVTPGFVIGPLNDTICFENTSTNAIGAILVPHGFYADLAALATAITNAINAVSWAVVLLTHNVTGPFDGRDIVKIADSQGQRWQIDFANQGLFTAAQLHSCRQLFAWLGYDTGINFVSAVADVTLDAINSVPYKLNPRVEIGQFNLKIRPNRRRPL